MKKEANNRQLAIAGLCVGWKVYKAGWKVCCWKVCWWQLAMAGLCGVVEWVTVVSRMAHVQCGKTCATLPQLTYHIYLCSYTMMRSLVVSDSGNT